jgi:hypothetical protein
MESLLAAKATMLAGWYEKGGPAEKVIEIGDMEIPRAAMWWWRSNSRQARWISNPRH